MGKRERLLATLRGEPVDRPAYSFWRHFYEAEFSAAGHVASMLWWQQETQNDFLKVQPRARFFAEDWGLICRYPTTDVVLGGGRSGPEGKFDDFHPGSARHEAPVPIEHPVKSATDWGKIRRQAPDRGAKGEQLNALRMLRAALPDDVLFVETVFTPLSIAARLVESDDAMLGYLRNEPRAVHDALEAITETYAPFVALCLDAGASGIFLATTQWGTKDRLTEAEYEEFGRPYDLRILDAVTTAPLNVLHVCENNNLLFRLGDYPAPVLNWAAGAPGNPTLAATQQQFPNRVVLGGVRQSSLTEPSPRQTLLDVAQAYKDTGGRRWIAGPDCSVPTTAPTGNVQRVASKLRALAGL